MFSGRAFMRPDHPPRLAFYHLPRTGGLSLTRDILRPNFLPWRRCQVNYDYQMKVSARAQDPRSWPAWRKSLVRLLAGHMPFGFAELFPGPTEYATMVRDPVARAVSDYYFCRKDPFNPFHPLAMKQTLAEFVEKNAVNGQNCYAHWLSNRAYGKTYRSDEELLESAMKNLNQVSLICVTEQYEESVRRLCARYAISPRATTKENRNDSTPAGTEITAVERDIIRHYNPLDLVIYEECLERFNRERSAAVA
jgi:hypothetical protein